MDDWLERQQEAVKAMVGVTVSAWDGVEMALRDESPDGPVFTDPDVRFLQLTWLRMTAGSDEHLIGVYQDGGRFGLRLTPDHRLRISDWDGIFRWRTLDLPTGRIDAVTVLREEDTLARIVLGLDGRELLLVAGEVHETRSGALEVDRLDESVLVFVNPADADLVHWR